MPKKPRRVKPRRGGVLPKVVVVGYTVTPLDPIEKCGPRTMVTEMYRVDEKFSNDTLVHHLVFLDRHGWYCEHGRECPAVAEAQKPQRRRATPPTPRPAPPCPPPKKAAAPRRKKSKTRRAASSASVSKSRKPAKKVARSARKTRKSTR